MRTITGQVTTLDNSEPLEGVHIALGFMHDGAFSPYPNGTISDESGLFEFTYAQSGDGSDRVQFSHIGYESKLIQPGQLQTGQVNDIVMRPTTYDVSEVTVTAARFNMVPLVLILFGLGLMAAIKASD